MRNNFGDAALPGLRDVLSQAKIPQLRLACAEQLLRANDPAGFRFARDAFFESAEEKIRIRNLLSNVFPQTRTDNDTQIIGFLSARTQ